MGFTTCWCYYTLHIVLSPCWILSLHFTSLPFPPLVFLTFNGDILLMRVYVASLLYLFTFLNSVFTVRSLYFCCIHSIISTVCLQISFFSWIPLCLMLCLLSTPWSCTGMFESLAFGGCLDMRLLIMLLQWKWSLEKLYMRP